MEFRPYRGSDSNQCLALFDRNTPEFFAPEERDGFRQFLDKPDCPYFVVEHEDTVVACGGYRVQDDQEIARLVWGMVRRDLQRQGLGRTLLLFRLKQIASEVNIQSVVVETSQAAATFYERQGFRIVSSIEDGWAPGLHRICMSKRMTVCN